MAQNADLDMNYVFDRLLSRESVSVKDMDQSALDRELLGDRASSK